MTKVIIDKATRDFIKNGYKKVKREVQKNMRKALLTVEKDAVRFAPVDTGYLQNARSISVTPVRGTLEFRAEYAAAVHEGVNAVQRVRSKTGRVFPRRVRRKPNPFLDKAIERNKERIAVIISNSLQIL